MSRIQSTHPICKARQGVTPEVHSSTSTTASARVVTHQEPAASGGMLTARNNRYLVPVPSRNSHPSPGS